MAFDITAALASVTAKTAKPARELREIPLHLIDRNPLNQYSMDGIESLADNIRLFGLMEPLLVRETDSGRYMLISGHRRRAALQMIAEAAENYPASMHEPVLCFVEPEAPALPGIAADGENAKAARAAAEELKLIYANADTRVLSSADTAMQVRRTRELLTTLRDLGCELPGKMRDHVAAAAKVSASRVARLDVIDRHLTEPTLRRAWQDGTIGETAAYEIARRPAEVQAAAAAEFSADVLRNLSIESLTAWLDNTAECAAAASAAADAEFGPDALRRMKQARLTIEHAAEDREARQAYNAGVKAMADAGKPEAEPFSAEKYVRERSAEDDRYRGMMYLAADSLLLQLSGAPEMTGRRVDDIAELKTQLKAAGHYDNEVTWDGSPKGLTLASVKYHAPATLRTWTEAFDILAAGAINRCVRQAAEDHEKLKNWKPVSAPDTVPEWKTGAPARAGRYYCRVLIGGDERQHEQRMDWDGEGWRVFGDPAEKYIIKVAAWWPLPKEELP